MLVHNRLAAGILATKVLAYNRLQANPAIPLVLTGVVLAWRYWD